MEFKNMTMQEYSNYTLEAMCKAHDDSMDLIIEEEAYLTNLTLDRFKNDCISILKHKYNLTQKEALLEITALENKDYLDYIKDEISTEYYVDEVISCWD